MVRAHLVKVHIAVSNDNLILFVKQRWVANKVIQT